MAKLTKEELISKIKDSEMDNEIKISLLEDVTDSFEEDKTSEWEAKYKDLEEKYIARFTEKTEEKEETETEEPKEEYEEMEEKEVIDIQEI